MEKVHLIYTFFFGVRNASLYETIIIYMYVSKYAIAKLNYTQIILNCIELILQSISNVVQFVANSKSSLIEEYYIFKIYIHNI